MSAAIRGPEVTGAVSQVARRPEVRAVLVDRQRAWVAAHGGGVVEGRDIGTVVLPDAPVKVFLTARDEVRAARRQRDEEAADRAIDVDAVRAAIDARDTADASLGRALRPEDAAPDALVIDTTSLSVDEVVAVIVERAVAAGEDADERRRDGASTASCGSSCWACSGRCSGCEIVGAGSAPADRRVHRGADAPVDHRRPVHRRSSRPA